MKLKQLRVAMLSVHSSPLGDLGTKDTGGMSVYIRELATELGRQGHLVDIYTRQQHPACKQVVDIAENVSLIHLKTGTSGYMHKLELYPHLGEFFQQMERFRVRENRHYDVVHSNYWLSGRVGNWAQLHWNVPHFVLFHTLGAVKNMFPVGTPEPDFRIAVEKLVIKSCSRILAETERERLQLMQLYAAAPDKISVVPCGVNFDLFRPLHKHHCREQLDINKNELAVLYVGRFDPLKGLDRLITAFSYLQHHQHLRLLIVGGEDHDDPDLRSLQKLSMELGVRHRVTFMGRTDHEDLPLYYSAADLLVLPSHTESFGLVGLEALACGTPVVATRVGAMDQIIRSGVNGYLVNCAEPSSLAEGIERAAAALRTDEFSSEAIRRSVFHYRWSDVAAAMLNEYTSAIRQYQLGYLPEPRVNIPLQMS